MPASKAQQAATALRRQKAVGLYLAGVTDWQQIADKLGYSSRGAAHTDVTRALQKVAVDTVRDAETLLRIELMRLDRLQAALMPEALKGDAHAAQLCLAISDRRVKWQALGAPIRHQVITIGGIEAEIAKLEAELADNDPDPETEDSSAG